MKCIICEKKINVANECDQVWVEINNQLIKIPRSKFNKGVLPRVHVCAVRVDDERDGDACYYKLRRGEFY